MPPSRVVVGIHAAAAAAFALIAGAILWQVSEDEAPTWIAAVGMVINGVLAVSNGLSAWQGSRAGGAPPTGRLPKRRAPSALGVTFAAATAAALVLAGLTLTSEPVPAVDRCPITSPATKDLVRLKPAAGGECYGFTATREATFETDAIDGGELARSQQAALRDNDALSTVASKDVLTVIWFGALSCRHHPATAPTCADDARVFQSEREDLQGLELARAWASGQGTRKVRIVLANGGEDMAYADRTAKLITKNRASWKGGLVVVGGADSRSRTRSAFKILLDAGIPVVSAVLTADPEPDRPFLDDPGFLQLAPTNSRVADHALNWLDTRLDDRRRVLIWAQERSRTDGGTDPEEDLFVTSLVDDLERLDDGRPLTVQHVRQITPEHTSICHHESGPKGRYDAVLFADRWFRFEKFLGELRAVCGVAGPELLIGNGSVNRKMDSDGERRKFAIGDRWPLAYYGAGWQCFELVTRSRDTDNGAQQAKELLEALRAAPSPWCKEVRTEDGATRYGPQVGNHVSVTWDEVSLALALDLEDLRKHRDLGRLRTTHQHYLINTDVSAPKPVTISGGTVRSGGLPVMPLCVRAISNQDSTLMQRSAQLCRETTFPASHLSKVAGHAGRS